MFVCSVGVLFVCFLFGLVSCFVWFGVSLGGGCVVFCLCFGFVTVVGLVWLAVGFQLEFKQMRDLTNWILISQKKPTNGLHD